jgi:hypothetical protein
MITLLKLWITDGISVSLVSINVWRLAGDTLNNTCNLLCCNHQVHTDFLITLYYTGRYKHEILATWIKKLTRRFIDILGFINILPIPLRRNFQFLADLRGPSRDPDTHKKQSDGWCQSRWPPGLRRSSAAARLLWLRVRIPPVKWMYFSC